MKRGDTIKVQSIGIEKNTEKTKNWNLNIKASWEVDTISLIDELSKKYRIVLKSNHILNSNSDVILTDRDGNETKGTVSSITAKDSFIVVTQTLVDTTKDFSVENQITYTNSRDYPYLSKLHRILFHHLKMFQ